MIKIQLYWTKLDFHSGQTVCFSFGSCLFLFFLFFLIFFMSVLLHLFVCVFFSVFLLLLFLFFLTQSLFYMRPWGRFPSSPESGLQLWSWLPNNGWLSSLMLLFIHFFYLLFAFFIHFTRLFLFFIFPCCFSLCLPLFFLFQLICFKRIVFSGILVLRTSWWFRAQAGLDYFLVFSTWFCVHFFFVVFF